MTLAESMAHAEQLWPVYAKDYAPTSEMVRLRWIAYYGWYHCHERSESPSDPMIAVLIAAVRTQGSEFTHGCAQFWIVTGYLSAKQIAALKNTRQAPIPSGRGYDDRGHEDMGGNPSPWGIP